MVQHRSAWKTLDKLKKSDEEQAYDSTCMKCEEQTNSQMESKVRCSGLVESEAEGMGI